MRRRGWFVRPFQELEVWRAAHALALDVYRATTSFPEAERFGLQSQLRRAAVSVASNIAEGSALTDVEFRRFLRTALGSATEVEYQILLARDLGFLGSESQADLDAKVGSIKRMLQAFIRTAVRSGPAANDQRPTAKRAQRAS